MDPSSRIPETMLAVRAQGPNQLRLHPTTPVPRVRPGYMVIRVSAVALNPSDYKRLVVFKEDSLHTMGCDVAGRVVLVGEDVNGFGVGDRVAGLCYSMKPGDAECGAFGQYALLKGQLSMRIPEHVSDAEAATVAVGINFGGLGLYHSLGLPLPRLDLSGHSEIGPAVLIYGGATATGMMALQLARLSGCRVLATCSPKNFQLAKALGAHDVFDYHDARTCGPQIRQATDNKLLYALDCVAQGDSLRICADALTSAPGKARYTASLPVSSQAFPRAQDDVRHGWTSGYSAFGEGTHLTGPLGEANAKDLEFAARFWKLAAALLEQDRIRLGPFVHLRQGGLQGVPQGLQELKDGRVSAGKLVYVL
ncbi:chaperonin 10-like protein [Podospora didyma]|uniref:Chaperonin 10-like protein n=1 Tax=Podospora didyma TaxID=330526 RepID=A0AAE0TVL2_9PEZI|nr:chaperonin 10-like protein [Podospora didyma]